MATLYSLIGTLLIALGLIGVLAAGYITHQLAALVTILVGVLMTLGGAVLRRLDAIAAALKPGGAEVSVTHKSPSPSTDDPNAHARAAAARIARLSRDQ